MTRSAACVVLLCLAAAVQPAFAVPDRLSDGMRKCGSETDATRRLACYDALNNTLPKIEADRMGLTAEIAQKREPPEKRATLTPPETLKAKIRAVQENSRGQLIFSLDNDQTWMQDQPSPFRFKAGEDVRIEHGALTSLWLVADHGRKTRVRRIS
jgi:hypothetical protein